MVPLKAGAGWGLFITGRDASRGRKVADSLSGKGAPAEFSCSGPLSDPTAPARLVGECIDRFGRIDAAGQCRWSDRPRLLPRCRPSLGVAVRSQRARTVLPHAGGDRRCGRGQGGAIVNILSINAHCGAPDLAVYSATKAALRTLTKNAANAHRFDRIRVNGINVGWARHPAKRSCKRRRLAMVRAGSTRQTHPSPSAACFRREEVAHLAVFLLSDAAGPMTGALIDQEQWVIGANN